VACSGLGLRRVLPHVWAFETSFTTEADPERVWSTWTDVEGWPRWHPGIAQASLVSPFAEGARGSSRAPGAPRSELRIGPVEPGRTFVSETILPFARLRFEHQIEPAEGGGTTITYGVEMRGPGDAAAQAHYRTAVRAVDARSAARARRAGGPPVAGCALVVLC
jgi:uncharacterized protein YndB with AHSA1/START domain